MSKYKQRLIPSVTTPIHLKKATRTELNAFVKDYYRKNIQGTEVQNKALGFTVNFSGQGLFKITKGSGLYPNKAIVVTIIDKLLKVAEFSNFGQPKPSDPKEMAGYLNFKAKVKIDGKIENVRIATLLYRNNGKIYWNHDVNKKKQ